MVMWDGNIDEKEPNPYNVGYHEDVKFQEQMKDYFPELVAHIDSSYRTLTDRAHRGIIGFSMGGFMSLFIAGKYPDSVCAAVSLEGSPEFFVGWPGNQTLYPIRYTFANLQDAAVYIRNGNTDILYYLNEEVHAGADWEGKKLVYETFPGGHSIDSPGETRVFEKAMKFVSDAFSKKWPAPANWSHYDLYPDFGLWGYEVHSDKKEPGTIFLKNVGQKGFGLFTHRWLPDGPPVTQLHISVSTAPVYLPGKLYGIAKLAAGSDTVMLSKLRSDSKGRLLVGFNGGEGGQIGIFDEDSRPELVVRDYSLKGKGNGSGRYLHIGRNNRLALRLFNRGGEKGLPLLMQITLSASDSSIKILNPVRLVRTLAGQRILDLPPFDISCYKQAPPHAEPPDIKFSVAICSAAASPVSGQQLRGKALPEKGGENVFHDDLNVPVWFNAPSFDSLRIDDGVAVRDSAWGHGNADGVADAGERIMLYQGSHRLRLYTEDPWVEGRSERLADEVIPARWPDGYTFSSIIKIAPGCPDGHPIEFLSSYETKSFNPIERKLHWGRVRLVVRHKD